MRVILKMIIVDDEPRHRKGLVNLIGKLRPNYEINQFKNGNEALEYLNKNKVDIIITDVKMPIMDGISFVKKHKENEKSAKIIILSGYANFEYAQNAISLGAFDYILKPVDEEIISEMLIKVEKSIYEVLILDLGDSVNGLFSILEKCDSVHTVSIEEPAAKAKLQQYTENLLRTGHEKILEHTVQKVVRSRNGGTVI